MKTTMYIYVLVCTACGGSIGTVDADSSPPVSSASGTVYTYDAGVSFPGGGSTSRGVPPSLEQQSGKYPQ